MSEAHQHFNLDPQAHYSFATLAANARIYLDLRREADKALAGFDLDLDQVVTAIDQIDQARDYAEDSASGHTGILNLPVARKWVGLWWARGLNVDQIAVLIAREPYQLDAVLGEIGTYLATRTRVLDEREVVRLHREGLTPWQMTKLYGWNRQTALEAIERCGYVPHQTQPQTAKAMLPLVVGMRNKGKTYNQIAKATGLSSSTIKSVLRAANKRGMVNDYGTRKLTPFTKQHFPPNPDDVE